MAKTFGEYADFLGLPMPNLENGDVITDIVAVATHAGDDGETISILLSTGTSAYKAIGMLRAAGQKSVDQICWSDEDGEVEE